MNKDISNMPLSEFLSICDQSKYSIRTKNEKPKKEICIESQVETCLKKAKQIDDKEKNGKRKEKTERQDKEMVKEVKSKSTSRSLIGNTKSVMKEVIEERGEFIKNEYFPLKDLYYQNQEYSNKYFLYNRLFLYKERQNDNEECLKYGILITELENKILLKTINNEGNSTKHELNNLNKIYLIEFIGCDQNNGNFIFYMTDFKNKSFGRDIYYHILKPELINNQFNQTNNKSFIYEYDIQIINNLSLTHLLSGNIFKIYDYKDTINTSNLLNLSQNDVNLIISDINNKSLSFYYEFSFTDINELQQIGCDKTSILSNNIYSLYEALIKVKDSSREAIQCIVLYHISNISFYIKSYSTSEFLWVHSPFEVRINIKKGKCSLFSYKNSSLIKDFSRYLSFDYSYYKADKFMSLNSYYSLQSISYDKKSLIHNSFCFICTYSIDDLSYIYCSFCFTVFHFQCFQSYKPLLSTNLKPNSSFKCDLCKDCKYCLLKVNPFYSKTIQCRQCENISHVDCLSFVFRKTIDISNLSYWKCDDCLYCKSCQISMNDIYTLEEDSVKYPEIYTSTLNSTFSWSTDYDYCINCSKRYSKKEYCPICNKLWMCKDSFLTECKTCKLYIHKDCERIKKFIGDYSCSICRTKQKIAYQKGILFELKQLDQQEYFLNLGVLKTNSSYLKVVKNPLDFYMIEEKILKKDYLNKWRSFLDDFNTMCNNSQKYYKPNDDIYKKSVEIQKKGQKILDESMNTLLSNSLEYYMFDKVLLNDDIFKLDLLIIENFIDDLVLINLKKIMKMFLQYELPRNLFQNTIFIFDNFHNYIGADGKIDRNRLYQKIIQNQNENMNGFNKKTTKEKILQQEEYFNEGNNDKQHDGINNDNNDKGDEFIISDINMNNIIIELDLQKEDKEREALNINLSLVEEEKDMDKYPQLQTQEQVSQSQSIDKKKKKKLYNQNDQLFEEAELYKSNFEIQSSIFSQQNQSVNLTSNAFSSYLNNKSKSTMIITDTSFHSQVSNFNSNLNLKDNYLALIIKEYDKYEFSDGFYLNKLNSSRNLLDNEEEIYEYASIIDFYGNYEKMNMKKGKEKKKEKEKINEKNEQSSSFVIPLSNYESNDDKEYKYESEVCVDISLLNPVEATGEVMLNKKRELPNKDSKQLSISNTIPAKLNVSVSQKYEIDYFQKYSLLKKNLSYINLPVRIFISNVDEIFENSCFLCGSYEANTSLLNLSQLSYCNSDLMKRNITTDLIKCNLCREFFHLNCAYQLNPKTLSKSSVSCPKCNKCFKCNKENSIETLTQCLKCLRHIHSYCFNKSLKLEINKKIICEDCFKCKSCSSNRYYQDNFPLDINKDYSCFMREFEYCIECGMRIFFYSKCSKCNISNYFDLSKDYFQIKTNADFQECDNIFSSNNDEHGSFYDIPNIILICSKCNISFHIDCISIDYYSLRKYFCTFETYVCLECNFKEKSIEIDKVEQIIYLESIKKTFKVLSVYKLISQLLYIMTKGLHLKFHSKLITSFLNENMNYFLKDKDFNLMYELIRIDSIKGISQERNEKKIIYGDEYFSCKDDLVDDKEKEKDEKKEGIDFFNKGYKKMNLYTLYDQNRDENHNLSMIHYETKSKFEIILNENYINDFSLKNDHILTSYNNENMYNNTLYSSNHFEYNSYKSYIPYSSINDDLSLSSNKLFSFREISKKTISNSPKKEEATPTKIQSNTYLNQAKERLLSRKRRISLCEKKISNKSLIKFLRFEGRQINKDEFSNMSYFYEFDLKSYFQEIDSLYINSCKGKNTFDQMGSNLNLIYEYIRNSQKDNKDMLNNFNSNISVSYDIFKKYRNFVIGLFMKITSKLKYLLFKWLFKYLLPSSEDSLFNYNSFVNINASLNLGTCSNKSELEFTKFLLSADKPITTTSSLSHIYHIKCEICSLKRGRLISGRLIPFIKSTWVHVNCLFWSKLKQLNQSTGEVTNVTTIIQKSKYWRCDYCKRANATISCGNTKCGKYYHFSCGILSNAYFQLNPKITYCSKQCLFQCSYNHNQPKGNGIIEGFLNRLFTIDNYFISIGEVKSSNIIPEHLNGSVVKLGSSSIVKLTKEEIIVLRIYTQEDNERICIIMSYIFSERLILIGCIDAYLSDKNITIFRNIIFNNTMSLSSNKEYQEYKKYLNSYIFYDLDNQEYSLEMFYEYINSQCNSQNVSKNSGKSYFSNISNEDSHIKALLSFFNLDLPYSLLFYNKDEFFVNYFIDDKNYLNMGISMNIDNKTVEDNLNKNKNDVSKNGIKTKEHNENKENLNENNQKKQSQVLKVNQNLNLNVNQPSQLLNKDKKSSKNIVSSQQIKSKNKSTQILRFVDNMKAKNTNIKLFSCFKHFNYIENHQQMKQGKKHLNENELNLSPIDNDLNEKKKKKDKQIEKLIGNAANQEVPIAIKYLNYKKQGIKVTIGPSAIHRNGLFAIGDFLIGDIVIEYVGEIITNTIADYREKEYDLRGFGDCYMFRIDAVSIIDASLFGNLARFINHSCDPNCYAESKFIKGNKHIFLYAKRYIRIGEEITYDYNFESEEMKIQCRCGAENCQGRLN